MTNLKCLSQIYKADKYELGYIDIYEQYFSKIKLKKLNILEIGIDKGSSLRVWSDYFVNSKIAAIDIVQSNLNLKNVKIFCGDQSNEAFLFSVISDYGYFDIIIDDGSHQSKHVIKSFNYLFNYLSENGIYIIEDLHCSYYPRYGGSRVNLNKKNTSMNFLKSLTDCINYENYNRPFYTKNKFDGKIRNVNFYQNCAVITKGKSKVFFYKEEPKFSIINYLKKIFSKIF